MSSPSTPDHFISWLLSHVTSDAPRGPAALRASRRLFALLGDPQDGVPAVHVVGTAGKGTVVAMISAGLARGGHTVVSHLSPHVYDVRERFVLDGRLAEWDLVLDAARQVAAASDEMGEEGSRPTFFAVTAALSAVVGRLRDADFLVVEAGIGGRVDATNVMSRSDVLTVITAIGLDHTDVLGATVEAIAAEKAAVLAGRTDVVVAPQPSAGADRVVRGAAHDFGVWVHEVELEAGRTWPEVAEQTAGVALSVLGRRTGRTYDPGSDARPPGRFERLKLADRRIILDGAHNPMKLAALADHLTLEQVHPAIVVAAIGASKNLEGCAAELARLAPHVIAATFRSPDLARREGHGSAELAAALRRAGALRALDCESVALAVAAAVDQTGPGDTIVVTGSFLHLSEARAALDQL